MKSAQSAIELIVTQAAKLTGIRFLPSCLKPPE